MAKIYKSVTELIGKTPIIELGNIEEKHSLNAKILAKLEAITQLMPEALIQSCRQRKGQSCKGYD